MFAGQELYAMVTVRLTDSVHTSLSSGATTRLNFDTWLSLSTICSAHLYEVLVALRRTA